ncbi:hypothetical protein SAMN03159343_1181 [Klenkia marina]|uniref:Tryptophan-associated transmembrane protein (Trp_oprn_chp) n=1 Tax=Klenkia marina TaxID=1960309 RepID=A0A1G4XPP0_9ACTN|nr:hypothetical protein [Klenkia marina]SCX43154.1 hypothetical protein SAMN03159343_1181 [Klenkia marina]
MLVLGLVTAVLLALGTVLPSVTLPDDNGSYGPLLQELGDSTYFLAGGLALLVAAGLLVAGALVQRSRARVGTGLLLVGGGMAAEVGLGQMVGRLQVLVDGFGAATSTAVGGVLLMLAGASAVALVVVGLVRLSRLARAS